MSNFFIMKLCRPIEYWYFTVLYTCKPNKKNSSTSRSTGALFFSDPFSAWFGRFSVQLSHTFLTTFLFVVDLLVTAWAALLSHTTASKTSFRQSAWLGHSTLECLLPHQRLRHTEAILSWLCLSHHWLCHAISCTATQAILYLGLSHHSLRHAATTCSKTILCLLWLSHHSLWHAVSSTSSQAILCLLRLSHHSLWHAVSSTSSQAILCLLWLSHHSLWHAVSSTSSQAILCLLWLSHHSLWHAISSTSSQAILCLLGLSHHSTATTPSQAILCLPHHWLRHAPPTATLTTPTATHVRRHAATATASVHAATVASTSTASTTTASTTHLAHLTLTPTTSTTSHLTHLSHLTLTHLAHLWAHAHLAHVTHLWHTHSTHTILAIWATKMRHVTTISDRSVTPHSGGSTCATLHILSHHLSWSVDGRLYVIGDNITWLGDGSHALLDVKEYIWTSIVCRDETKSCQQGKLKGWQCYRLNISQEQVRNNCSF